MKRPILSIEKIFFLNLLATAIGYFYYNRLYSGGKYITYKYILLLIIFFLVLLSVHLCRMVQNRKKPEASLLTISFLIIFFGLAAVVTYIVPQLVFFVPSQTPRNIQERVYNAYYFAGEINDKYEENMYLRYWETLKDKDAINNFDILYFLNFSNRKAQKIIGEDGLKVNKDSDILFIPNRQEKISQAAEKKITNRIDNRLYDTKISSMPLVHMTKENILFRIGNYIETKNYTSAEYLYLFYKKQNGEDEALLKFRKILDNAYDYINIKTPMNLRLLQDLYIYLDEESLDIDNLAYAYYVFSSIKETAESENMDEFIWFEEKLTKKMEEYLMIAGDIRLKLFHSHNPQKIIFIEKKGNNGYYIFYAKDGVYYPEEDTIYLDRLEVFFVSNYDKKILWQIAVPYAKIVHDILYSVSIERGAVNKKYNFEYVYKDININFETPIILDEYKLLLQHKASHIDSLRPSYQYVMSLPLHYLIRDVYLWKNSNLPINLIIEILYIYIIILFTFLIVAFMELNIASEYFFGKISLHSMNKKMLIICTSIIPLNTLVEMIGISIIRLLGNRMQIVFLLCVLGVSVVVAFDIARSLNRLYSSQAPSKILG